MRYAEANWFQRLQRRLPAKAAVSRMYARILPPLDRLVFRLTRGRQTLTSLVSGLPVVLLETTGARSGARRLVPVLGLPDGEDVVVIASNWGQDHHPAWYHNLCAEPSATITVRGERRRVVARETSGEERRRHWQQALEVYPAWRAYEARAGDREIPVIMLGPARDS